MMMATTTAAKAATLFYEAALLCARVKVTWPRSRAERLASPSRRAQSWLGPAVSYRRRAAHWRWNWAGCAAPSEAMTKQTSEAKRPSHYVLRMACERRTCGVHDRVQGQRGALAPRAPRTRETSHLFNLFCKDPREGKGSSKIR